jgi:hypothetical protein
MNIIFLDVDGVLNMHSESYYSSAWVNLGSDTVEVHLMKRLEYLVEEIPDAHIIISSAWQESELKRVLNKLRFKYVDKILGRTPRHTHNNRGDQINEWLDTTLLNVLDYVVLEDEVSDVCGERCSSVPKNKVVETDMHEGLSHKDVLRAIDIIKGIIDE